MNMVDDLDNVDSLEEINLNSFEDIDSVVKMMNDLGIEEVPTCTEQQQLSEQEKKRVTMEKVTESVVHAFQCDSTGCRFPICERMKRVIQHTKICERKRDGMCPACKELISLCYYHAKVCQDKACPAPFCPKLKQRLSQMALRERLKQALHRRRLLAVENSATFFGGAREA